MAWIKTVDRDAAGDRLRELYSEMADPQSGELDNILEVHSLRPDGLAAHWQLYRSVMRGSESLPKVEREMIAVVVSGINRCHY